ncbi:MAG: hypothetical protein AABW67_06515 [Nanoarchaeota archaeon]
MVYKANIDFKLIKEEKIYGPFGRVEVVRQYSVKAEITKGQRKCIEGLNDWLEGSKISILDKIVGAAA